MIYICVNCYLLYCFLQFVGNPDMLSFSLFPPIFYLSSSLLHRMLIGRSSDAHRVLTMTSP